jgi:aminoglycoside phosphotransferase (APT) family kinase protein
VTTRPGAAGPGPVLARGREAVIHDAGHGRVLRRYLDASRSTELEANVMVHLAEHGFPVPGVVDAEGPDLLMSRVDGPTMLDDAARRPWRLGAHARALAELHQLLHALPVPPGLRAPFGAPEAILHLDLHPANVLLGAGGPVVIDWTNVSAGPAAIDEAQTWLLLATSEIPATGLQRRILALARGLFLRALLARLGRDAARSRLPLVAQLRQLDPNVTDAERLEIAALVDRLHLDAGAARASSSGSGGDGERPDVGSPGRDA